MILRKLKKRRRGAGSSMCHFKCIFLKQLAQVSRFDMINLMEAVRASLIVV